MWLSKLFSLIHNKGADAKLVFPYNRFLYEMTEFPADVKSKDIQRDFPEGERRLHALSRACRQFPDRADLWLSLVRTRMSLALYDVWEYDDCIETLKRAASLDSPPRTKRSIDSLLGRLKLEREELLSELGDDQRPPSNPDSLESHIREGRVRDLQEKLEHLKAEVQPKGILASNPRDRELWYTYQATISALFQDRQPEDALKITDEFHERRIAVGLTPIPDYNLQELIIGYLLQVDVRRARRTVKLWLTNSRAPSIRDTVKYHPELKRLFGA